MARLDQIELVRRARRAYEMGRLRMSARILYVLAPVAGVGLWAGAPGEALVCLLGLLAAAAIWLRWRGGASGLAVLPGLIIGWLALLGVSIARASGLVLQTFDGTGCFMIAGIGLVSGIMIGRYAAQDSANLLTRAGTAAAVASMTACFSCAGIGMWAVVGIATAICAGSGASSLLLYATQQRQ